METVLKRQASAHDHSHGPTKSGPSNNVHNSVPTNPIAAAAGNQAVQRLLGLGVIRAKLSVSSPTDPDEREADRVAERVMSSVTPAHGKCDTCASGSPCSTCARDERIQAQHQPGSGSQVSTTPNIKALRGGGQPLATSLRSFFEPRFGRDFGAVRVHTDGPAAESASAIQANAYTYGSNIVFGARTYEPDSSAGQKLLAHELSHVVQQGHAAALPSEHESATGPTEAVQLSSSQISEERIARDFDGGVAGSADAGVPIPAGLPEETMSDAGTSARDGVRDATMAAPPRTRSREDTLAEIRLINNYNWIAPWDETRLEELWNSFGDALPQVAPGTDDSWTDWNNSIEGGAELWGISSVRPVQNEFLQAVITRAQSHLDENRTLAEREKQAIGASADVAPTANQSAEITARRDAAQQIVDAQRAMAALRTTRVGYDHVPGRFAMVGSTCHPIANEPGNRDLGTKPFDPRRPPQIDPRGDECERMPTWALANEMWTRLNALIEGLTTRYPTLYAVTRDLREGDVASAEGSTLESSRRVMLEELDELLNNISATEPRLNENLPLELFPIHQELFSREPWSSGFNSRAAHALVDRYQNAQFWRSMGLGALSAALFIVASLATGGLAAVLFGAGAGLSLGMAANSWAEFRRLHQASRTNLSDSTALVTSGQANAALFTAVLDTVFAFLDVYGAARGVADIARGVTRGSAAAGRAAPRTVEEAVEAEARSAASSLAEIEAREGPLLAERLRNGAAAEVTDEALRREGYVLEVEMLIDGERHFYRRLANGRWCRHSVHVCGLTFPGEIDRLAARALEASDPAAMALRAIVETAAHEAPTLLSRARITAVVARLQPRFPVLARLREGAIERIVRAAHAIVETGGLRLRGRPGRPNVDIWLGSARGQLLEEIANARVRSLLDSTAGRASMGIEGVGEMVFIEGSRIRDTAGAMLTDGIVAVRRGDRLEIIAVVEAKAGGAAAGGLTESLRGLNRSSTGDIIQAILEVPGGPRSRVMQAIQAIDPEVARGILATRGANTFPNVTPLRRLRLGLLAVFDRLPRAERNLVFNELAVVGEGQISRDLERLWNAEDGTISLMIDRQRVTGTFTTRPSFIGVAPNDVSLASAATRLRSEGHRFNRLDLGVDAMSTDDIADLARRLVEELGNDMRTAAAAVTP